MKLSEVCIDIFDCEHKTAPLSDEGYPSIRTPNIGKGRLILDGVNRVSEETWRQWTKRAIPQNGDLILAREAPAGNVAIVPPNLNLCLGQRTVLIRPHKDKVSPEFLCYYLLSPKMRHELLSKGSGSTVAHVNVKDIKNLDLFELPSINVQHKIASILSAYDDLIENNLKRIKLLEEISQRTYEEWFVKFRVKGVQLKVNEDTGLPMGWERISSFDAMEVMSGGTPKTDIPEYWGGSIEFYTPKDASLSCYTNGTEKHITEFGLMKCNSKLYPADTVFITARGTVGKVNLASKPMAMNQSCYALKGRSYISQLFLFNSIISAIDQFKGAANGGVFDAIVIDTFKFLPFTKPPKILVDEFDKEVRPLYEQSKNLLNQNRLLKEAQDILLPRLMSGMLKIEGSLATESLASARPNRRIL